MPLPFALPCNCPLLICPLLCPTSQRAPTLNSSPQLHQNVAVQCVLLYDNQMEKQASKAKQGKRKHWRGITQRNDR